MKNVNSIIRKLAQAQLVRSVTFNTVPVIYFESLLAALVDNPYLNRLDAENELVGVAIEDGSYEGWQLFPRRYVIQDNKLITMILDDIEKNEIRLKRKILTITKLLPGLKTAEELSRTISELYKIGKEFSYGNALLNEECIMTKDSRLLQRLPKVRQKASINLIVPLWHAFEIIIKILEKKYAVSRLSLNRLRYVEFISELKKDAPFRSLIASSTYRPVAFVLWKNKMYFYCYKDAKVLKDYLHKQDPTYKHVRKFEKTGMIYGTVVVPGKVRGKVVILLAENYPRAVRLLKRSKEYILVTPMTRPEITLYLKNAKAFVTDEGGVTCHAAIVAREMKKPCVIGTKIATKVLKDDDVVEVDANKGVVRVIKKSNL